MVRVCEVMIDLKPHIAAQFDKSSLFVGKSRVFFSYNKDELTKAAKKLSNTLWVETKFRSQDITKLFKEIIKACEYSEEDINFIVKSKEQRMQISDEVEQSSELIKFSSKYGSIEIDKDLIVYILKSIKEIDEENGCIETKELLKKVSYELRKDSKNKYPRHLLNNIIKALTDIEVLIPFQNSKRGKYVIEDYETIHNLITKPEIIKELLK